ncbi:protein phosphatase 1F isoform X1 [Manacus candei]|nr:protein phosphatase 1F isoform X1 [Manacus candei]
MARAPGPSAAPLGSFLRDFPAPLGPGEPLPWSSAGSGALSRAEVPGALAERARSLLGGRGVSPLLEASLIHAAVDEVLQTDLTEFKLQNVETEGEGDEERFTLLDGESLQRCFFNKLRDICSEWHKQLPSLRPLERFLLVSIHAIRNTRRKMEDRHVLLPEFNQLFGLSDDVDRAYFAVFDGHGGVDAANYSATHLHVNVGLHEEIVKNPAEALKCSFQKTDEMFLFKAKREKLRSGTTGVSALIVGNKLHIAWLGDSQVMLVQQGKAVTLMEPHKPEREDERARIETLGGCVTYMDCWRVNGTLAVSRAIGNVVRFLEACNTNQSVNSAMSARKIRDYNSCCVFGMDQYWMSKKKILLFACYSIGILKLISGNSSSHPDYRTSETFLSLYFLVPADCFQTFALFRVGEKLSDFLHLLSSLSLTPAGQADRLVTEHVPRLVGPSVSVILQGLLWKVMSVLCLCSGKLDLCDYSG